MSYIKMCQWFVLIVTLVSLTKEVTGSAGDRSPYYQNCVNNCLKQTCQNNVLLYKKGMEEKFIDHLIDLWRFKNFDISKLENMVHWNCRDECKYTCMHKTTNAFLARKWKIPQFHGKWPFVRILGIQEPASVFFSLLNFYVHYKCLMKFRQSVRPDSPLYKLWHTFSVICLNAWIWSTVFHTRDFPITELFDYVFAYSMVLASFWCMVLRVIHGKSTQMTVITTTLCVFYFLNHLAYLSYNNTFDYAYNMKVNIVTGVVGGIGWVIWSLSQIRKRFYVWKMLVSVVLALVTTLLEVYDFPPILWIFDAHSLWHLSSAPITILLYEFIIDDCVHLRKELMDGEKQKLI